MTSFVSIQKRSTQGQLVVESIVYSSFRIMRAAQMYRLLVCVLPSIEWRGWQHKNYDYSETYLQPLTPPKTTELEAADSYETK